MEINMNESISPFYSSIGRRTVAQLLDGLILIIPCTIANHVLPLLGAVAVWFFYAPLLESSEIRATLGKHMMGIQVTDLDGRRASLKAAIVRNIMKAVSSALLFLGHFFAFFSRKKQTLHDMLAETVVVYGRSDQSMADAWMQACRDMFNRTSDHSISALERLEALREKGALTQEEFEAAKRKILH